MQLALSSGFDRRVTLHTSLTWFDKTDIFALAEQLSGSALLDLVIEDSHSCYRGQRSDRHRWGTCPPGPQLHARL